ncbi:bifunctional acetate--CoA ligase family protein/GNAT family N-acetyltransferase [Amycolatopsis alkalitolerans]|uniref:GNAT family N-acetyltransferase n=1 Tax=Amycolatopsis alkalitolerans TaxID=2547244 RepID=A0A5C4M424_9PSEU|nr:bifunctional GNAT family N-acetyltransferase/acetate--CoA ligase family protein [Amycolatopsis alkalitolerans]TNC24807.1 GNAT family N-acetyltransferase [Amycolatopsis alkalitolerans]
MPTDLGSTAVLADGEVVLVRPLRPQDTAAVLALHDGLDERDRYLRFFGTPAGLDKICERIAGEPGPSHGAVGAFRQDQLVGCAHFEVSGDPTEAEVALAVDGRVQAHGVGTLLLEHLASAARAQGIRRFTGEVLAENTRMVRVFADLGLPYRMTPGGPERQFVLVLEPGENYWSALAERERVADVASLRSVLRPESVAVIGASRHPGSIGHAVLENLIEGGYPGKLFAVNPHATEISGVPCAPSVPDLPEVPELAVVCVPAPAAAEAVEQCGRRGVRAAVVITAGLTGTEYGERAVTAARTYGMRLVGPNCIGVASPGASLNATFLPGVVPAGPVGVVSQSGGFGIALLESLRQLGIGLSSLVSTGDKYDVSGNDLLLWWQRDPHTEIAVLYLESFGNPRKFGRLARTLARSKPVLAIRTGETEIAQRAAASHTAAAATPAVTRDALYEQAGVIAVDTISELVETVATLSWQPLPQGNRVAVISNAGGAGVLAADACARHGLTLPDIRDETRSALHALLPEQASLHNPVDTTAGVGADLFGACLDAVLADPGIDAVLAATVPTALGDPMATVPERARRSAKPVLAVRLGQLGHVEPLTDERGPATASFTDPADAAAALGHVARYARWRATPAGPVEELSGIDPSHAVALVQSYLAAGHRWLAPLEVAELLRCFGLPLAETRYVTDEDGAAAVFQELKRPLALKADVEGMLHKSAGGGVALDVTEESAVRDVVRGWRRKFGAAWHGAVLQPMAEPGRELLVGINSDEVFGPLVVFGLGGTDTDLVADRAARLAPLSGTDADRLLGGLRSSAKLFETIDRGVVRDVLLRVSRLAELVPEVAELDLNPLVVNDARCVVLDARIRIEPRSAADPFLRRLRT